MPEITYVVAHGQMAAGELDDRMNAFYDGKYDVLLATSIVESGLDIPTANTMVVHRADMFGLSQLYQIRGRVGRAKTRAYCFLTTKPRSPLTPQASKRLRLLGSLDSLGAGFNLAAQDLDLRGAGNLLGEEQSGHIREVGYELYQAMLEDTIARLRAGQMGVLDDDGQWAPQINLGVPVMIPEAYVPDLDVRLGLYRRLSGLHRKVELEGFAAELIDRFGELPREVNTLMLVIRIKAMCKKAGIARLDAGPKGAVIQFHNDKFANPGGPGRLPDRSAGAGQGERQQDRHPARLEDGSRQDQGILRHRQGPGRKAARPGRGEGQGKGESLVALLGRDRLPHQAPGQRRTDQRAPQDRHHRAVEGKANRGGDHHRHHGRNRRHHR